MAKNRPENQSLLDEVLEKTYTLGPKLGKLQRELMEPGLIALRSRLKNARLFCLDDDFARLAAQACMLGPQQIAEWVNLAHLPFETTWIEMNYKPLLAGALGEKERSTCERVGFLLERDEVRPTAFSMTTFLFWKEDNPSLKEDKGPNGVPNPNVVLFDRVGGPGFQGSPVHGNVPWNLYSYGVEIEGKEHDGNLTIQFSGKHPVHFDKVTELLDLNLGEKGPQDRIRICEVEDSLEYSESIKKILGLKAAVWGWLKFELKDLITEGRLLDFFNQKNEGYPPLMDKVQIAIDPCYSRPWNFHLKNKNMKGFTKFLLAVMTDLMECSGSLRLVVTVLAMLNELPVILKAEQPTGKRFLGLKQKPYLGYNKVSINLPKGRPIEVIQRLLKNAVSRERKAHEVRSHWRTFYPKENWGFMCRPLNHDWVYDHANGYRLCGKCGAEGRLIKEFYRGNAALGWVSKEYALRADKYYVNHPERLKKSKIGQSLIKLRAEQTGKGD